MFYIILQQQITNCASNKFLSASWPDKTNPKYYTGWVHWVQKFTPSLAHTHERVYNLMRVHY